MTPLPKPDYDLILARDAALRRAEQAEADYAMLRAVARKCFQEESSEQDMLRLWNLAASVDHPGAALLTELAATKRWAKRWKRKAKGHRANFYRVTRLWSVLLLKKVKQDRELEAARALRAAVQPLGSMATLNEACAAYDVAVKGE